jgi:two-component system LytT family sensor kinase
MNAAFRYILAATLLFMWFFIQMDAQQSQQYSKMRMPDERKNIELLLDSAETIIVSAPLKAFDYVEKALELSITGHDQVSETKCYVMLGRISYNLQQYDLAVSYYLKALSMPSGRDEYVFNKTYLYLGQACEKSRKYTESIEYYEKYLEYVTGRNMLSEIIAVRYDLARVYTSKGEYNKALREYDAIQKIEENQNNPEGLANVNTLKGDIYLRQDNPAEAIATYRKAVDIASESKNEELKSKSLRNLGKAYRSSKQYNEELEVRQQSLEISKENKKLDEQAEDNLSIGEIYMQQERPEQAVSYFQKSINLSDQTGSIEKKGIALKTLSDAYKEQGAYDKALSAYKEYTTLVDSSYARRERELQNNLEIVATINRKLQRIDLLEKDFELNRQTLELLQKEQELNIKELKNQKRITYSLLFVILVLVTASLFVYRSWLQKKRANMLLALRSLRSQMNPHFIFNSLNSVNSFIAQNNERMANKYLSEFSHLMRQVLENSKHDFVPVSSEVEIINLYLKLEQFRFSDKFEYNVDIDSSINLNDTKIPPMLIQPYIENAIWHGLRYKESKGKLTLVMKKDDDFITVVITDDGIGRKQSQELKTKHQKTGFPTGLKNTQNRLSIINDIYKTKFKVSIKDMDPEEGTGTVVKIRIPVTQRNSDAEDYFME